MHEDPRLAPMLESMRASGRKVFLATNSLWDYTHVVMNFLICGAPSCHLCKSGHLQTNGPVRPRYAEGACLTLSGKGIRVPSVMLVELSDLRLITPQSVGT